MLSKAGVPFALSSIELPLAAVLRLDYRARGGEPSEEAIIAL